VIGVVGYIDADLLVITVIAGVPIIPWEPVVEWFPSVVGGLALLFYNALLVVIGAVVVDGGAACTVIVIHIIEAEGILVVVVSCIGVVDERVVGLVRCTCSSQI
jgi:hypothetical protein